jgi:hypothetical protein
MGRSGIFWLISHSSRSSSSKRGVALFRGMASGAHALCCSVTVVAGVVSTSALLDGSWWVAHYVTSAVCETTVEANRLLARAYCSEDAALLFTRGNSLHVHIYIYIHVCI